MDIGTAYVNGLTIQLAITVIVLFFFGLMVLILFDKRKTQKYRKYIADLYVAAKIRFFTKEDNLDLVAEEKTFKSWNKKQSGVDRDVDSSVAAELKERIENSTDNIKVKKKD